MQDQYIEKFVVFYGTFIDTPSLGELRVRPRTAVGVSQYGPEAGSIKFVEEAPTDLLKIALAYDPELKAEEVRIVEFFEDNDYSTFFFPGFIDTHIHASQYPNIGLMGKSTLLDWLEKYTFPMEMALNDPQLASLVYQKVVERCLDEGTTTAAYFTTISSESSKILAHTCSERGQRAFIGKVCMNQNSPDYYKESTKDSIESCVELISYLKDILSDDKVLPILTPRFAPACSGELLFQIGKIAKDFGNLNIQTHLSENVKEIEWVKKLFPDCSSYTDVYRHYGLLTGKTVLAHAIHLSDIEASLIKESGSSISHCPISNSTLSSGECRVRWLLDKGINVGLGTDVSAGFSISILDAARQAHQVSRHVAMAIEDDEKSQHCKLSVNEVLYLATVGGAKALSLDSILGTFDIGKQFDAQLINLTSKNSKVDIFSWDKMDDKIKQQFPSFGSRDPNEYIAKWLFNGDRHNVEEVWVAGRACKRK